MKKTQFKQVILLFFCLIAATTLHAQDLIITTQGDTLNIKIQKVKNRNIYFKTVENNEIKSTSLPANEVEIYQYNFYKKGFQKQRVKVKSQSDYSNVRIAINGGWSYRTEKANDDSQEIKSYYSGIKNGFHFGLDVSGFFSEHIGLGLKYVYSHASGEMKDIPYLTSLGGLSKYNQKDKISINYIAPVLNTRILSKNKKNSFIVGVGIGYMGYVNASSFSDNAPLSDFKAKGSTLGFSSDIGYDIALSKTVALGFQVSYLSGTIYKIKDSSGTSADVRERLQRVDLSIGLRFNL